MAIVSFILNLLRMIFGGSRNAPSAEAVEAANGAQAKSAAAVASSTAAAETRMAQAAVDAPKTSTQVEDSLDRGTF